MYLEAGDFEKFLFYFNRAIILAPEDDRWRRIYGVHLQQAGTYEEAFEQYKRAYEINPSNRNGLYLGIAATRLGYVDYAIEVIEPFSDKSNQCLFDIISYLKKGNLSFDKCSDREFSALTSLALSYEQDTQLRKDLQVQ